MREKEIKILGKFNVETIHLNNVHQSDHTPAGDAKCIWKTYYNLRRLDYEGRVGFAAYGIYKKHPATQVRSESVAEHTLGTIHLARLFAEFWPHLFNFSTTDLRKPTEMQVMRVLMRLEELLLYHDLGEGDVSDAYDDGSISYERDQEEYNAYQNRTSYLPNNVRGRIIPDFKRYQNPLSENMLDDDAKLIQLAKVIDKLDAILRGFVYEKKGQKGTLCYKREVEDKETEQDKFYAKFSGDNMVDHWAAKYGGMIHGYHGYQEGLDVICAAALDVRGKWFDWWDKMTIVGKGDPNLPKEKS